MANGRRKMLVDTGKKVLPAQALMTTGDSFTLALDKMWVKFHCNPENPYVLVEYTDDKQIIILPYEEDKYGAPGAK